MQILAEINFRTVFAGKLLARNGFTPTVLDSGGRFGQCYIGCGSVLSLVESTARDLQRLKVEVHIEHCKASLSLEITECGLCVVPRIHETERHPHLSQRPVSSRRYIEYI
jgi:hypothetical protein